MARARRSASASKESAGKSADSNGSAEEFKCPECGRTFGRAAALGAHRKRAHGVAGTSASSASARGKSRRQSGGTRSQTRSPRRAQGAEQARSASNGIDRDALLKALFPDGVPPRESVIREVSKWLDEAERLAKLR